jgi:hypothetical protein
MKRLAFFLGLIAALGADLAFGNAIVSSITGPVQVQSGSAPARTLRLGDIVRQGDTVITGPVASTVLRFEDGQITALSANSRMTVSTYSYNAQSQSGSVLLSLVAGGMRAITGLIGRNSPQNVAYKAASATIGIRGTDVDMVRNDSGVVAAVNDGVITFALAGQSPVVVAAGEGIHARPDGTFSRGAVEQVARELAQTPQGQQVLDALRDLQGLSAALNQAGTALGGPATTGVAITPGSPGGSTAGGGGASIR